MRSVLPHVAAAMLLMTATGSVNAQQEFEDWNLEPGISQAHLVMVARVTSISRVTIVEGAKTDIALREFRFQPVRVLKGLFQRDELSMTASDLGLPSQDASIEPPLKEAEFRLLILTQPRGLNTYGCVSAAPGAKTFGERVPLLKSPDDPLVSVAETLIRVVDSRSRKERATLLIDRLRELRETGVAVVPLLTSLNARADWAAQDGTLYGSVEDSGDGEAMPTVITQLIRSPHAQVRGASIELLRDMFASGIIPNSRSQIESVANVLKGVLQSDEGRTSVRLAAIEAFNHLLSRNLAGRGVRLPRNIAELLADQATEAPTYAERAAATEAFSRAGGRGTKDSILESLKRLPLDEPPAREELYLRAAARVAPADAERLTRDRLQRSIGARQSLEAEVETLIVLVNNGSGPPLLAAATEEAADALEAVKDAAAQNATETAKDVEGNRRNASVPLLLEAATQSDVSLKDRQAIAGALGRFGDDRGVSILVRGLRDDNYQLGSAALAALEAIDSDVAAREIRPLLKTEPQLSTKLRIARLLARHGIDDGYSLATEHLADTDLTASAALVLAALDDPRTAKDLTVILEGRPDRRWQAAALTGLVVVGDEAAKKRLLDILNDERNPLAADAAVAVGLSADAALLPPLAKLVQSRNPQIAMSSLVALRRFFSGVRNSPHGLDAVNLDEHKHAPALEEVPEEMRKELAKAVTSLVADPYVAHNVRQEAFAVARLLDHHEYESLLSELADQAELEGTPLLAAVQAARKRQRDFVERLLC